MVLVLHIDIVDVIVRWSIVDDAVFIAKWEYICFMRHMILWVGLYCNSQTVYCLEFMIMNMRRGTLLELFCNEYPLTLSLLNAGCVHVCYTMDTHVL